MQCEFQNNHAMKEDKQVDYILYESIDIDSRKYKPLFIDKSEALHNGPLSSHRAA